MHSAFKKSRHNGGGDVVGQIGDDLYIFTGISTCDLIHVCFENIGTYHAGIFVCGKHFIQNRYHLPVNLYRRHMSGLFGKSFCKGSESGTYLDDMIFTADACCLYYFIQNIIIRQEVLPELLLRFYISSLLPRVFQENMHRKFSDILHRCFQMLFRERQLPFPP